MFKKDVERRLRSIFGFEKVTFSAPDKEVSEQYCLFVEIDSAKPRPYGKDRICCRVVGKLIAFSQDERLPYGFFAKRIEQANPDDKKSFIFETEMDVADSASRYQNIHERHVNFIFLYDAQYDPDRGELTEINLSLEIGE